MIKNIIKRALFNYVGDGFCTSHNIAFLFAYQGRHRQYIHISKLAKKMNFNILAVPSGQGIIIKN